MMITKPSTVVVCGLLGFWRSFVRDLRLLRRTRISFVARQWRRAASDRSRRDRRDAVDRWAQQRQQCCSASASIIDANSRPRVYYPGCGRRRDERFPQRSLPWVRQRRTVGGLLATAGVERRRQFAQGLDGRAAQTRGPAKPGLGQRSPCAVEAGPTAIAGGRFEGNCRATSKSRSQRPIRGRGLSSSTRMLSSVASHRKACCKRPRMRPAR